MISAALRPSMVVVAATRNTYGCSLSGAVSWSVFGIGAMKTILFSFATTETAGPSAEVRVPTRKSTFSLRISSRDDPHRLVGVALGVADEQLELAAQHAALGVDLFHEHLRALGRRARRRARGGPDSDHREADLDRLLGVGGERAWPAMTASRSRITSDATMHEDRHVGAGGLRTRGARGPGRGSGRATSRR